MDNEEYKQAEDLIKSIFKFKKEFAEDLNLLDTIVEYSYKKNIPIQEIGNILSNHKDFKTIFKKQLIKEKYFKSEVDYEINDYDEDEW